MPHKVEVPVIETGSRPNGRLPVTPFPVFALAVYRYSCIPLARRIPVTPGLKSWYPVPGGGWALRQTGRLPTLYGIMGDLSAATGFEPLNRRPHSTLWGPGYWGVTQLDPGTGYQLVVSGHSGAG